MNFQSGLIRIAAVVGVFAAAAVQTGAAEKVFPLPLLSVSPNDGSGSCLRPTFRYLRRADDPAPLSLAIAEDLPGGAGESLRAGMWLAAMVAALERMDDLSGVRLSLELSGRLDGPSAGAGFCLAILSALDDREFPPDCAVTGTIMPDGTIGIVGGIGLKIKAAAAAGIRRVLIPAYLRFEKDPATGVEIDLKRLASSLQIELVAVENVAQAYAVVHRQPAPSIPAADRRALELPEPVEEVLKRQYQDHHRAGTEIWDAIPPAEREQIAGEAWLKSMLVDDRIAAENAYRSGRLALAAASAWSWRVALDGRKKSSKTMAGLRAEDLEKKDAKTVLAKIDSTIQKASQAVPDLDSFLANEEPIASATAAQFYADYYELAGMPGIHGLVQRAIDAELATQAQPERTKEAREASFQSLVHLKGVQLLLAECSLATFETWQGENHAVCKTMTARAVATDIAAVERLFFSVHLAARNAFRQEVIRTAAERWQRSDAEALQTMMAYDTTLVMQVPAAAAIERFHERLAAVKNPARAKFAAAVSAHLQAESLGVVSGLMTRWNELDLELTDANSFRYGRTDLLNYLLTAARANALEAIAACHRKDLPCLAPIFRFESAEMTRDNADADKVDVLISYWTATLQAKVLLMSCGEEIKTAANGLDATQRTTRNAHDGARIQPAVGSRPPAVVPMQNLQNPAGHNTPRAVPPSIARQLHLVPPLPGAPPRTIPKGVPLLPDAPRPRDNSPGVGVGAAILFWFFVVRKWGAKKEELAPSPPTTPTVDASHKETKS